MDDDLQVSGTETPTPHAHHHHHHPHLPSGRRVRQFFRPDGRKVHVANSPEEVEHHRRRQSSVAEKGTEDYDVVLHGSIEHVEALREAHSHHQNTRDELRLKHGDTYDEFERVHQTLDTLNAELHLLSEHAVQLDANFSKYGYSAHLRTKDSPNASSANSLMDYGGDHESDADRYSATRSQGETMRFFSPPVVRQYFHKGLLWRAHETTEVASYELFVDLFYVGIIAISGDGAAEEATGKALLKFCVTFIMAWKFWNEISTAIAWFDADDVLRRFSVLFILVCLLGLTTNIAGSWDTTYTPLVSFYIAGRWFSSIYYLWMAYLIPMVRPAMIGTALHCFLPGFLWIGSVQVEEPGREALIWTAIFFDLAGAIFMAILYRPPHWFPKGYRNWADNHLQFIPGANIEHRIERTGAFLTLVFGYSVVALLYQSNVAFGINAFFGKAVLGLIQAFAFNWLYFEVDSFNLFTHAIRRAKFSGQFQLRLTCLQITDKIQHSHGCSCICPSQWHSCWREQHFPSLCLRTTLKILTQRTCGKPTRIVPRLKSVTVSAGTIVPDCQSHSSA